MNVKKPSGIEPDITVLVSCYNEEDLITQTLEFVTGALQAAERSHEIIVIDDASSDQSAARVREFIHARPDCLVALKVNATNRGLANNYIEGAFLGRGKYYRLVCGDAAEPTEILLPLFGHIGEADMIIPYQKQKDVIGRNRARKVLSGTFTFLVNILSGYHLEYYNGSAIHLRYNVMRWHPSSYGFGFQADMITRLLDEGASYVQVPSSSVDRKGSSSTALTVRNLLSVGHTLLELLIRRLRRMLYGRTMPAPVEILPASKKKAKSDCIVNK